MNEVEYHYMKFLPPDNTKCPICGAEQMQHVKRCGRAAALICETHCQECEHYNNTLSIGFCRFNEQEKRVAEVEKVFNKAKKALELRGVKMVFNKAKKEYMVYAPWNGGGRRFDVFKAEDAFSALDCFLMRADKRGRFEIKTAVKEHRKPELAANVRGVDLHSSEGGVWYISREDKPDEVVSQTDALEAWVRFVETVDIVVRKSIATAVKNFLKK